MSTLRDGPVVVTGFGRCGTSLAMQMLHAGGHPLRYDEGISFETSATLQWQPSTWWRSLGSRAVKLIMDADFSLLPPYGLRYRFVFLRRDAREQAKSQAKLLRLFSGFKTPRRHIAANALALRSDAARALEELQLYPGGELLVVDFEELLAEPRAQAAALAAFVGGALDVRSMAAQVRPRGPRCLSGLLEVDLVAQEAG